jgi:hypothetical protein
MAKASGLEQMVLEALERALADPTPRKMHGTKAKPGIFLSASAAAKAAASQCLERGLVRQIGQQGAGTKVTSVFGITPAGVALVLERSPMPRLLAAMLDATDRTAQSVAQCKQTLDVVAQHASDLRLAFEQAATRIRPLDLAEVLRTVPAAEAAASNAPVRRTEGLDEYLIAFVHASKARTPLQPVTLPDLFRHASAKVGSLSIGQFHDSMRRLAGQEQLRLLPYTQAMYQLAEPEYALILGREVMYYAEPGRNSAPER